MKNYNLVSSLLRKSSILQEGRRSEIIHNAAIQYSHGYNGQQHIVSKDGSGWNDKNGCKDGSNETWDGPWCNILEYEIANVLAGENTGDIVIINRGAPTEASDKQTEYSTQYEFALRYNMSECATGTFQGINPNHENNTGTVYIRLHPPASLLQQNTQGRVPNLRKIATNGMSQFRSMITTPLRTKIRSIPEFRRSWQASADGVLFSKDGQAWTDIIALFKKGKKITRIVSFHAKYNNGTTGRFIGLTGKSNSPFEGLNDNQEGIHPGARSHFQKLQNAWDEFEEMFIAAPQAAAGQGPRQGISNVGAISNLTSVKQGTGKLQFIERYNAGHADADNFKQKLLNYLDSRLSMHDSYIVDGSGVEGNLKLESIAALPRKPELVEASIAVPNAEHGLWVGIPTQGLSINDHAILSQFPIESNNAASPVEMYVLFKLQVRNDPIANRVHASGTDYPTATTNLANFQVSARAQSRADDILDAIRTGRGGIPAYPNAEMRLEFSRPNRRTSSIKYYYYTDNTFQTPVRATKTSKHDFIHPQATTSIPSDDGSGKVSFKVESVKYSLVSNLLGE